MRKVSGAATIKGVFSSKAYTCNLCTVCTSFVLHIGLAMHKLKLSVNDINQPKSVELKAKM